MHLIYRNLILIFIHYTELFIYIGNEQKGFKVKDKVVLLLENNISFPSLKDSSYLCDVSYYNDAHRCTFLLGMTGEKGVQRPITFYKKNAGGVGGGGKKKKKQNEGKIKQNIKANWGNSNR